MTTEPPEGYPDPVVDFVTGVRQTYPPMVVCHCNAVNDREIRAEILAGALDAEGVAERCDAGTRCGSCRPIVEALLAEHGVTIRRAVAAA